MYCRYFGFREKPFNITPDPAFIYFSKTHQEAFAHLSYGIDSHIGFMGITGEVGTGKTTLLRTYLAGLDGKNFRTALIFNPCLSSIGLMQSINREFGIPYKDLNNEQLLDHLNQFLLGQNAAGNTVVLVIDEAQNLKREVLEQIRLISNLETETDKLIQIVLSGQPELDLLLNRPELRQLKQRIAVHYQLCRMDFDDTAGYIGHRLAVAGGGDAVTFTRGALKRIYRFSRGVPRLVNIVCDRCLLLGYSMGKREINSFMATVAVNDIRKPGKTHGLLLRPYPVGVSLLAIILLSAVLGVSHTFIRERVPLDTDVAFSGRGGDPAPSQASFPDTLRGLMSGMTETSSAVQAFNILAHQWKVEPFSISSAAGKGVKLESLASARSLQLSSLNGNLGSVLRTNSPVILELDVPGVSGKRYIALTGVQGTRLQISPAVAGRNSITPAELESVWTGRNYVLWKNFLNIPPAIKPGNGGDGVSRLQVLLKDSGVYNGPMTGVFDRETIAAVQKFQSGQGIEPDGLAGKNTLMLLYRSATGYIHPELAKKGRVQER